MNSIILEGTISRNPDTNRYQIQPSQGNPIDCAFKSGNCITGFCRIVGELWNFGSPVILINWCEKK